MKSYMTPMALAIALLSSFTTTTKSTPFNATFDTLSTIPDEGRLSPVGICMRRLRRFVVNQPGLANITFNGVMPESEPIHQFSHSTEPNQGLINGNFGNLTVSYTGSTAKHLALISYYYGCSLRTEEAAASIATACNIPVQGFKAGGSTTVPVVAQKFEFMPAEAIDLQNPMTFGEFKTEFTGLESAVFSVVQVDITAALIDTVVRSMSS